MELATFLVESHPPAFPLGIVVYHIHPDECSHAGEGIDHQGDDGSVTKPNDVRRIKGIEEQPRFVFFEYRRLAHLHGVARPTHGRSRVCLGNLADNQVVEELANGGEMLFYRRRGLLRAELLNVGDAVAPARTTSR